MGKIGRNDPCPCGSGKKYKKCCLLKKDTEEKAIGLFGGDAVSLRMSHLLGSMNRSEFMHVYKDPARDIERAIVASLSSSPDEDEAEQALLLWKQKLEDEIKRLGSYHSKYYWLCLSRRIYPETTEPYDRPSTPYLHRTTFNLALLKYGNDEVADEFVAVPASFDRKNYILADEPYNGETVDFDTAARVETESDDKFRDMLRPIIIPRQITQEDAIHIYQIEYLALHYYMVTAQLRRLWKGGKPEVHDGRILRIGLPKKVRKLVDLYDERQDQYSRLLSSFGSITNLDIVRDTKKPDPFLIFVPILNIEKHETPLVFPGEEFFGGKVKGPLYVNGNPHNYIIAPLSLRPFYGKACMFRKVIEHVYGYSPEEIVTFLLALGRHHQSFWLNNIHSRYSFFQRGYTIMPLSEDFLRYLTTLYGDIYKYLFGEVDREWLSPSCEKLLNRMTYDKGDFKRLSLWDRTGVKLCLPVPAGLLTDHSAIPDVLASIFSELSILASTAGEIGQIRGDDFEKEIEKHLEANIDDYRPWIFHRKLLFTSGVERDIDVSLLRGSVLFVIECKAFSVPRAFDRGEPSALRARKEKLNAALNQVDTLCQLLSKERKGRNFEIPEAVTHIISLAASPFPEYIDDRNDYYFLTPSIPRVCTAEEITEFVRHFQLSAQVSKPFVWVIS